MVTPTNASRKRKKPGKQWYLYVLLCSDSTLYTGITNDLPRRLDQHNSGTASRYTRSRVPVQCVYKERCKGKSSALKKEYAFKQFTRNEKRAYINEPNKTIFAQRRQEKLAFAFKLGLKNRTGYLFCF